MNSMHRAVAAEALGSDVRATAKIAQELGYEGLLFHAPSKLVDLPALSNSGRRELLRVLSSQNQQLVGIAMDAGPKGFGPGADVDRLLAGLQRIVEAAAGLSAPLICLDVGPLPPAAPTTTPTMSRVSPQQAGLILIPEPAKVSEPEPAPAAPDPAFIAQLDASFEQLGRVADRYSVIVAMRSELASFASLAAALQKANCPWFGVDLDAVAVLADQWGLDQVFSEFAGLIRHVRARDAVVGANRRTRPTAISSGNVSWPALLGNLRESDYRGWITVDPMEMIDRAGAAKAGLAALNHTWSVMCGS